MSASATPVIERQQAPDGITFTDLDDLMGEEPCCEAKPDGKRCFRSAAFAANLTTHGCRRDGVTILLCEPCYCFIKAGSFCSDCNDGPIFIASARSL